VIADTAQGDEGAHDVLTFDSISKRYPGTQALSQVSMSIVPGEIHALAGQNGAGKSTLIRILAGVEEPDEGTIAFRGKFVRPSHARLPINFIHQDMGLVASMTVGENLALSIGYGRRRGLISWRSVRASAQAALDAVGSPIRPDAKVADLSTGQRAIVAIARAMATEADVIVLDEPTAALTVRDVEMLFDALRRLRVNGVAMLYVTHRLDEVFRLADNVTVLRDGVRILSAPVAEVTLDQLVESIAGRSIERFFPEMQPAGDDALLSVDRLRVGSAGPVSFELRRGEVVALVGLRGGGQDAIGRGIFGAERPASGAALMSGVSIGGDIPRAMRSGVGFVSGRRSAEGLGSFLSVRENLLYNPDWVRSNAWRWRVTDRRTARALVERFGIVPGDTERAVITLSGGNQQKVMVARWIHAGTRMLILEEPTAGVDVGARSELYGAIADLVAGGGGCLLVSSDFDEVAGLAHRALVFDRGRVAAELSGAELTATAVSTYASGGHAATGPGRQL
jgi:ribose transport system ATP-binding protein